MGSYKVEQWNGFRVRDILCRFNEAQYPCRVSCHYRVARNILGDHAPGAHNCILADRGIGKNPGAGADRRTFLNHRPLHFPVGFGPQPSVRGRGPGIGVVDEHHAVPYKYVVFHDDAFTNKRMAGYLATLSDNGILLDLDECAYLRLAANFAAVQVYKVRELYILPQFHVARDAVVGVHRSTRDPLFSSDSLAASSIFTTRSPERPSLNGSCPLETQSTK